MTKHASTPINLAIPSQAVQLQHYPDPGSPEEREVFERLQTRLPRLYSEVFSDSRVPRTVVVVPSFSLDGQVLSRITAVHHYEERMLCMLMLLRYPCTRIIYVTSQPLNPTVIDYFLGLLPGIPGSHARKRLKLLSCHDASMAPLSRKILERPRLIQRIRNLVSVGDSNHLTCFNSTHLERTLSVRLGLPLYSCDPELAPLGSKSNGRKIFRQAGIAIPDGFEDLKGEDDLVEALASIKRRNPALRRGVVKLNEGFSGEGNAIFPFDDIEINDGLEERIRELLPTALRYEAPGESWATFLPKFEEMEGIVECFIEGEEKRSPSVQCRVTPTGETQVISTHDQVLGGPSGQVFLGCTFPAVEEYRLAIQNAGADVGDILQSRGVIGRFAVDFISVQDEETGGWKHYAIEINLRKGGTTHPFMTLQFLTDGQYDMNNGLYFTPAGEPRYYYASDNLESPDYRGLSPEDLIDITVFHRLHFHGASQEGVVFQLFGALSEFGKLGIICIGATPEKARELYDKAVAVLDKETEGYAAIASVHS